MYRLLTLNEISNTSYIPHIYTVFHTAEKRFFNYDEYVFPQVVFDILQSNIIIKNSSKYLINRVVIYDVLGRKIYDENLNVRDSFFELDNLNQSWIFNKQLIFLLLIFTDNDNKLNKLYYQFQGE